MTVYIPAARADFQGSSQCQGGVNPEMDIVSPTLSAVAETEVEVGCV